VKVIFKLLVLCDGSSHSSNRTFDQSLAKTFSLVMCFYFQKTLKECEKIVFNFVATRIVFEKKVSATQKNTTHM